MELILFLLLPVAMWFLLLRPQQARVRAQRELIAGLGAGDRVVTAGGIVGTLRVVGDTQVALEVSPGVELQVLRAAISRRLDPTETDAHEGPAAADGSDVVAPDPTADLDGDRGPQRADGPDDRPLP